MRPTEHFATIRAPRLRVELRAGHVRVDTRETAETVVDVRALGSDNDTAGLVEDTIVEQRGQDVIVQVPTRERGLFGRTPRVRLDIVAPHGTRLDVKAAAADVDARGSYGESQVSTGSGDITIETLTGPAQIRAGIGTVRVDSTDESVSIGTGTGDVHLGSAAAAASVQSGSGDVHVSDARAALRVQTGSGDVAVDRASEDLRVQTGSGDVAIGRVQRGRVTAHAASGDLRVGVAEGTAAWLDVRTLTGGVTNHLDAAEPVGAGEPYVHLDLDTVSGDIEIVRA